VTISELTERELVARIQQHLPPPPPWMLVGIGDDAAVVEPERNRLEVLSVDALVEDVHFERRFTPPHAIGHRALAVNLSDLAAMGATPRLALLSFALPPSFACEEFDGLIAGLAALAARYRLHVAGGNLARSPGPLVIDITIVGTVKRRQVLTRSGARPGDEIYVSGTIGAAAAGLQILKTRVTPAPTEGARDTEGESCVRRYLYPEPRVRLGLLLGRNRAASACVDLSDGLADGVVQIAHASRVGVTIDGAAIPIDPGARTVFGAGGPAGCDAIAESISRGDDYELLFAVRPRTQGRLRAARRHGDVQLTRVGVCTANPEIVLQSGSGDVRTLTRGYGHFR
jgi:thiamine-monophosphate kinase